MTEISTTHSAHAAVGPDDLIARGNALVERVGDEVVIVDLSTHRVSTLNAMGARIWELLETPTTVRSCVAALSAGVTIAPAQLEHDTQSFVETLLARGLLQHVGAGVR